MPMPGWFLQNLPGPSKWNPSINRAMDPADGVLELAWVALELEEAVREWVADAADRVDLAECLEVAGWTLVADPRLKILPPVPLTR